MSKKSSSTPLQRLKEQLQAVDVLFEVRDARLPETSVHPRTMEFFGSKPRILVFCKEDLADPERLRVWGKHFRDKTGIASIALSLKINRGKDKLISLAKELCREKLEARKRRGLLPRPIRVAVVGLPNVGKSSLINWLIGKKKAAVANTPGVTRANSWIRIDPEVELLDTPGMLPSVAFKGEQAAKLALCNILPPEHYDVEETALYGLDLLETTYPQALATYDCKADYQSKLEFVASARACLKAGGLPDLKRAAAIFLSEFRSGKLGRVVLDNTGDLVPVFPKDPEANSCPPELINGSKAIIVGTELMEDPEANNLP